MAQRSKALLTGIIAFYVAAGIAHMLASPIMEIWDEPWHYPLVEYLATNGLRLPVQDSSRIGPWLQQGGQPPLYYLAGAVLTAGIDTSDMELLRRLNPHAATGAAQPDGNANLFVHRADLEAFPWRGTTLAVYLLRFVSIWLGAATIIVTYALGRELFPDQPLIALGAAALNAFLPMFVFISASVSNDNLSNLLGGLLMLFTVRLLCQPNPTWRIYAALGLVMGAGLLAKLSLGFFIPLVALALLIVSARQRSIRPLVMGAIISGGLTILIAGWWYVRNFQLYGDPTGLNVFLDIVGRRTITLDQLWTERFSLAWTFWGTYGNLNIVLPQPLYVAFDLITLAAGIGLVIFFARTLSQHLWPHDRWIPAFFSLGWPLIAFASLIQWTSVTYGSQGRLLFIALSPLCVWMAVGLSSLLPVQRLRFLPLGATVGYFAVITFTAPMLIIAPTYTPPQPLTEDYSSEAAFIDPAGGQIELLSGSNVQTTSARPGEQATLTTIWRITTPIERDLSLFVHLTTPDGVIVAQRDVYPGGGLLATSELAVGYTWKNPLVVNIPRTAYAPITLDVRVGWYYLPLSTRLTLPDGADTYVIGQLDLHPVDGDVPNPLHVNFGHEIALVGYDLSRLSAAPDDSIDLTLYWRGLQQLKQDYVVFANIIDPNTFTKYAVSNAMPANWSRPTTTWTPDEIVEDRHTLKIVPDALPGIYVIEVGLYIQDSAQTFPRLRIVPEVGSIADDYLYLSRVRILSLTSSESEA